MRFSPRLVPNALVGMTALLFAGSQFVPGAEKSGPVLKAASAVVSGQPASPADSAGDAIAASSMGGAVQAALSALSGSVSKLSHPAALEDAFRSYFAYKAAHPDEVKKPYLYFVDYGLASTEPRGYVFDMSSLTIVDGPFTVAHGRGSSVSQYGVPTKFSNANNSHMTSLGLYVTKALYGFSGHAGGQAYNSVGLRLDGVSTGFNDNAFARKVVAHGAPYVTPTKAGRSEGCPAMEPGRAKKLLPMLADGAMVFLFAPNDKWMESDPWVTAAAN
jgi:hypothetical protein